MTRKVVKNVTDMEIDEISVVDRTANQYADVAIAKRGPEEETVVDLFDEAGVVLDLGSLENGQVVYDGEGNAYQFEADETMEGLEFAEPDPVDADGELEPPDDEGDEEPDELAAENESDLEMAKGFADPFLRLAEAAKGKIPTFGRAAAGGQKAAGAPKPAPTTAAGASHGPAKTPFSPTGGLGAKVRQAGSALTYTKPGAAALGTPGKRAFAGGVGVGAGGAGAMAGMHDDKNTNLRKSFSEEVMEELSKAMSDDDRDVVLSKALGQVEDALAAQGEAMEIAKSERQLRLTNEYISKAAEYNLPVDPEELGPVLYRMVETMDHDDCVVIAKCLDAASSALFDEVGFIGGGDNDDPLERVNALVSQTVSKAADAPSAFLDAMDDNPAAYDQYLAARRSY